MIGRVFTAAFVLLLGAINALACSFKVLLSAAGGEGKNHVSIKRGQALSHLDHLLRDPTTGDIVVCNRRLCYPAFALDQHEQPQEIIRLEGCKVDDASSDEDGLERHKIEDIETDAAPRGDSVRPAATVTMNRKHPPSLCSTE